MTRVSSLTHSASDTLAQAVSASTSTAVCAFCARTLLNPTLPRYGARRSKLWQAASSSSPHAALRFPLLLLQVKEKLAQSLFDHIPVGVGSQGIIPTSAAALESALSMGMDW